LFAFGFSGIPGKTEYIIKMAVLNVALAVVTYFLNKRAVKKQIKPRLDKVDDLIKIMQQE
jgi:hypothetical protein